MILMSDGYSKQRHKPIAQELVDGALVAVHGIERQFKEPIQQRMHVFGTKTCGNRGRVCQVTEQHRHLFPFAFQSAARGQYLFGEVFGGVGKRLSCMFGGWKGWFWCCRS